MKKKEEQEKYIKTFKYRCYPNVGTRKRFYQAQNFYADIWNKAKAERDQSYWGWFNKICKPALDKEKERLGRKLNDKEVRKIYSKKKKGVKFVNSYMQQYHIVNQGLHPENKKYDAQSLQYVLTQIDGCYKSFFSHRAGGNMEAEPPGYERYHKAIVHRVSGWRLNGNILELTRIGRFRLRMHRPIAGRIKTVSVTNEQGRYYACFACEMTKREYLKKPAGRRKKAVVIAFGNNDIFIADSDGKVVLHPEFYEEYIAIIRRVSRKMSRQIEQKKKEGRKANSNSYKKTKRIMGKLHRKVAAKRNYFLECLVDEYVRNYHSITIQKRPLKQQIQFATTSKRARKLCDAAYGRFEGLMKNKCREYGVTLQEIKDENIWEMAKSLSGQSVKNKKVKMLAGKAKKKIKYQTKGKDHDSTGNRTTKR